MTTLQQQIEALNKKWGSRNYTPLLEPSQDKQRIVANGRYKASTEVKCFPENESDAYILSYVRPLKRNIQDLITSYGSEMIQVARTNIIGHDALEAFGALEVLEEYLQDLETLTA